MGIATQTRGIPAVHRTMVTNSVLGGRWALLVNVYPASDNSQLQKVVICSTYSTLLWSE